MNWHYQIFIQKKNNKTAFIYNKQTHSFTKKRQKTKKDKRQKNKRALQKTRMVERINIVSLVVVNNKKQKNKNKQWEKC